MYGIASSANFAWSATPAGYRGSDGSALDDGAAEEVGVGFGPEPHRVREREVAEIRLADVPVLDELPCLGEHAAEVGHVPVPDVRREDRRQARPRGIATGVERERVHRVVGLTAEEVLLCEDPAHVVGTVDPARRELVDRVRTLVGVAE